MPGRTRPRGRAGQAEIGHFHLALPVYEHVVGLDVQVQNLIIVSDLERMGYGFEHAGHHIQGKARRPLRA